MNNLYSLPKLPGNIISCMVDIVGLYPNILHEEGLCALRKWLDNQMEKSISNNMICELAEVVFKDSIFKYGKKVSKQKTDCTEQNLHQIFVCGRTGRGNSLKSKI